MDNVKEKTLMDDIRELKKLKTDTIAKLRSKHSDQLSKLKELKDEEVLKTKDYQYRVRDLDQAFKLQMNRIEKAFQSKIDSIKKKIVHGAGYSSKIPDTQATQVLSKTTPIGNPKRYMRGGWKWSPEDLGKTAEEVASKSKGNLKKAALATAGAGLAVGGALVAKNMLAKRADHNKKKSRVKESEMFKQYLSSIVIEVVRSNNLTPSECIKTIKEVESMTESECRGFLSENMKYAILTESKNFKKKVSDHVGPKPENDAHIKKDARSTSKYVKQKKDVTKMLSGIKKKFREQVAYSILQSVKESRDESK